MRKGPLGLLAVLCLSVPHAAVAQVVRGRVPVVPSLSVGLPLSSPIPMPSLNSGLPANPQLSLSLSVIPSVVPTPVPVAAAVAVTAATPKATPAAVVASVASPILAAVKAAKPQPPQAAPKMESSASALFDGITARSSPAVDDPDPVFPGDDSGGLSPRSPRRLSRAPARAPASPHRLEPQHMHGDGHDHEPGSHPASPSTPAHEKALKLAMAVSLAFIAVELLGGVLTHSASLQADALHLLSDQLVNGAALFSAWLSRRKLGGFPRVEAFVGLLAAGVIGWTGVELGLEAFSRFFVPGAAATWSVAAFALASLASNLSAALILRRHHGSSLGVKSAFLVAMTDTVGSIGVIVSAAASILLGWGWAEPVVVALIGAMIVKIAWGLGKPAWKAAFAPRPKI